MASSPAPERMFSGQEVGDFLLRACHDLRSQLRAVRVHTELLAKQPAESTADPRLTFILQGANNLNELVDQLAEYSLALRIDPVAFTPTPTGVLLRTALARLAREPHKYAEVTFSEMPRVLGDPDRITQLFETLLRYRGRLASRIRITAGPQADRWLFTLSDNGPDVEPGDLERMFHPFTHGLGMAAAREIVERHGGRIWAESHPGTGCTIFFTLGG